MPAQMSGHAERAVAFVADFVGADRGVRRLAVTCIEPDDLFRPPQVGPKQSMLDVRAAVGGADSRWAVVLDGQAHLRGWVDLDPALTGSVEDNLVPFDVPRGDFTTGGLRGDAPARRALDTCGRR